MRSRILSKTRMAVVPARLVQCILGLIVAASVASGRSDCGLGVLAAARAFGLEFIPVSTESYDLVLDAAFVGDPLLAPLWDLLSSARFQESVRALGGYDTSETGKRVL